ncbi:caspase family protein [Floridanema evergladense]|uniref:Caspase family protein n=1 Tax=Floridaenema evergladense BLCC-F167 TaxID=3153639 RepID=A0ABV4WNC7_9CYAN
MKNFIQNLAIAIGINQYQNSIIAKLTTAKPDAETLANLLRDEYHYQVELITDDTKRKPTLEELENLLTKWLPEQLQQPANKNRLLFYFAGHGMALESDDGPRGFLLPQDANPNPKPGESNNFLSMQVLHDALIALPCHHLIVILDCCFAGTFRWASTRKLGSVPETIRREHYDRFIRYPAWQVITSAAHNQEALDFLSDKRGISKKSQAQEKKHSPFAEALFEALQDGEPDEKGRRYKKADLTKDGVITAPELYLYLRDNVETRSSDRQTPGLYPLKKHDRGEYIFHDPNFDPQTLSKADPIDETNNPYRGLKPFEEEHARFFFGRQELIEKLYARIAAPDNSLTVVLGVSGSGKSSLVKAGLIPYLRELSEPEIFALNLVKVCILTSAILDVFPKFLFLPQLLPINDLHQWHILNPIRPGESPFAALARTIWAIADIPTTVQLDSLGFLSERLNQKTEQLNTQVAEASSKHGETSRTTQRLKQEAEKFTQITATWNQDTHAAKQLLIVEHFEVLYALCQSEGEPESQQQRQLKQVFLACLNPLTEQLQSASNSFVEIVKAWSQKHPGVKLLLVIDQFEELITLTRKAQPNPQSDTPEEWQQFLQLLETTLAANLPQLRIIVTLRSDFEPRFLNSEALKSYWTRARFPVRAMRSDELRQAIEGPASEMALYFEPANLVDRLIDEVGQMPGALPLLSFTLSEFYIKLAQKWRDGESSDRALTIDASFDKEGGVAGSLTRRANEEYEKLGDELGEAAQQTMRRVMLRMLTLEGGESARRRVPESELVYPTQEESDRVKQVVDQLVEARLLVKGQLETGEPYVEPAHDFLVRGWKKLLDWINEEQGNLDLQQRLTPQANDWHKNNQNTEYLWIRDPRLALLEKLLESKTNNWLNQLEREFVYHSKQKRIDELEETKERLRISEERRLAAELELGSVIASRQFETERSLDSLLLAMRMGKELLDWKNNNNPPLQNYPTVSPLFTLQTLLDNINEQKRLNVSEDNAIWEFLGYKVVEEVDSVPSSTEFRETRRFDSPDGQHFVTLDPNGRFRIWTLPNQLIEEPTQVENNNICNIIFSPNGQLFITMYDSLYASKTVVFWNLSGYFLGKFSAEPGFFVKELIFSPNSQQFAFIAQIDGGAGTQYLHFFEVLKDASNVIKIGGGGYRGYFGRIRFTENSNYLVTGKPGHPIRYWNLKPRLQLKSSPIGWFSGEMLLTKEELEKDIYSSGQQNLYLTKINDGKITFHKGYKEILELENNPDWFEQAFLTFNEKVIASVGNDGIVRFWNLSGKKISSLKEIRLEQYQSGDQVIFSRDGQYIGILKNHGIFIQNRLTQKAIGNIAGDNFNFSSSVSFSPDGQRIATVGSERTVRIWDLRGRQLAELNLTNPQVASILGTDFDTGDGTDPVIGFSCDGKNIVIAVGEGQNLPLFWEVEELEELLNRACQWLYDYIYDSRTNSREEERQLCKYIEIEIEASQRDN